MAGRQRADGFVRVRGLADFQRELRRVDRQLPRELAKANQQVAQHVVDEATANARQLGPMWARAARSLSAARQQRLAAIRFGGARHPEAMGAEFGAVRGLPRQVGSRTVTGWNQFRPWRGSGPGSGYFLYPAVRREGRRMGELYEQVLADLASRAFPD